MKTLYVLAYPVLSAADRSFIDRFRDRHDAAYRDVVAPHFTQVFGCHEIAEATFCTHVDEVAQTLHAIDFVCRYAMLGADHESSTAHVFLVPEEGYSALANQHDKLYTGVLAPHLRLDIPFVPHINIGTVADRRAAKSLCDDLNNPGLSIAGRVDTLTVGGMVEGKIKDLASYRLDR